MRPFFALALAAAVLPACAGHPTFSELTPPVRLWDHEKGLCGNEYAMDGEEVLWTEGGCEHGGRRFRRDRRLDPLQAKRIAEAFTKLPPAWPTKAEECGGDAHVFKLTHAASERVWIVCGAAEAKGAPAADLPAPFDGVVKAFLDLR